MGKVLTEEEIKELMISSKSLGFSLIMEDMLSNDDLKIRFADAFALDYDDPKREKIIEEACLDIAMQFTKSLDLEKLATSITGMELHDAFAKVIIRNQDKLNVELNSEQLVNIAFNVEDVDFLRECVDRHEEYGIDDFGKDLLDSVIMYHQTEFVEDEPSPEELIAIEKFADEVTKDAMKDLDSGEELGDAFVWEGAYGGFAKGYYNPLSPESYETDYPLDYSEAEKFAIRIYEGVNPGGGSLGDDMNAYKTINAMNYPGISNELERIFDDKSAINPSAIFQHAELMQKSLDLFSVMYKYGQRMTKDRRGYRVDRASAAKLVYETGKTVSNFSTSTTGYKNFSKADIALEEVTIMQGTPCADFKEVLGMYHYELATESEILVAPGCIVDSKPPRAPETAEEKKMKNKSYGPASAVYEMTISAPEKPKELTQEEEEDVFKSEMFISDVENRKKAASFIAKLLDLSHQGYSKEDVMKVIDPDELANYLEWKEAFQRVYQYRTRQIALEIDRKVKEAKERGEPLFTSYVPPLDRDDVEESNDKSPIKKEISMKEIQEMTEKHSLEKQATTAKKLLDFLNKVKSSDKNKDTQDDEQK